MSGWIKEIICWTYWFLGLCALNKTDPQLCSIICWRLSQLASLLAVWFYDLVKLDHRGHDCVGHCFCLCVPRAARVAVVKSRDMHWSLLAQRDQRDISLSSLRMLIVADGANPCESICRGSFNKTTPWSPKKLLLICFVCLPGALCVRVCVLPQGRYPPAMPSSTCFSHVGCDLRWSVHVPALQKQWLSPSAGALPLLHLTRTKAASLPFCAAVMSHHACNISWFLQGGREICSVDHSADCRVSQLSADCEAQFWRRITMPDGLGGKKMQSRKAGTIFSERNANLNICKS